MRLRHGRLEQVGRGGWAVVALPDRGAVSNAGIVDLGGEALVFDTHFAPGAARELRAAAEELVGPVRTVVDSHWHGDHVRGNGTFSDATILATQRTRELIATRGEERLRELRESGLDQAERDLRERGLAEELELLAELREELPAFVQRLPDEPWDERRELGRAELLTWGGGHTDSDAILWLAEGAIAFTADLVFVDMHPWLGHGDPEEWLRILDRLDELGIETLVPGHGPVATGDAVATMRTYIEAILEHKAMPAAFEALDHPELWERNLAALHERATKSAS